MVSDEIEHAKDFINLMKLIESNGIKGIGSLTYYDTAFRIGYTINIFPTKIYLQAGALIGAERLLQKKIKSRFIEKIDLPKIFQIQELECWQIEDILCIYKDYFNINNEFQSQCKCTTNNKITINKCN